MVKRWKLKHKHKGPFSGLNLEMMKISTKSAFKGLGLKSIISDDIEEIYKNHPELQFNYYEDNQ